MKKVSIIIPCYNEEENIPLIYKALSEVCERLTNYRWEFLFIDDGSKDNSLNLLEQLRSADHRVNFIEMSRNFGKEVAMLAGFDYTQGDCAIIIDADLQHPPHIISKMLEKWEEGYDDVYGKRISRGKESIARKILTKQYYRILSKSSRIDVLPNVGDFRLLDKACIDALRQMRENNRYTKGMYCYIGYKKTFVEFYQGDRIKGKSSWNLNSLLKLSIEGIMSYTTAPLKLSTYMGLFVSIGTFLYMLYVLVKTLIFGDPVQGFPTLLIVILFLGGIQLLSLGIIGEYLARVFIETKRRPVYFVRKYNGARPEREISEQNIK